MWSGRVIPSALPKCWPPWKAPRYVVRRSLHDARKHPPGEKSPAPRPLKSKKRGLGFSMVELLSTCPTNWGMTPANARVWLAEHMLPYYPVGDFKVSSAIAFEKQGGN
jgi:2-oxoglutarate ferredoxin oxidoreductase subunit beta